MKQNKLLMLGTSKGSKEMIEYAQSQGIYTIVTDFDSPEVSTAKQIADEYWMISADDFDALEAKCREEGVDGVACGISTFCIPATVELCRRLGFQAYCTPESWHYTVNKYDFKVLCKKCGVPVATDYKVSNPPTEEELSAIHFPVVVKAVDQSANRGMSYCTKKEEIAPAIDYAHSFSKNSKYIVERMLHGHEYTAYYALVDGEASLVCLYSDLAQPGTPNNCYALNSTACDKLEVYLKEVDGSFKRFLQEGGVKNGVCWIELILDEDGHFYVIEMGYRMSGDMMAIPIHDVTGFNSYKWLVDYALGAHYTKNDLPAPHTELYKKCGCAYILWSGDVEGVVDHFEGVDEILSLPGVKLTSDVEEAGHFGKHQYLLTFTFTRDDADEAIRMINLINERVKVIDTQGNDVSVKFTDMDTFRRIYEG